MSWRLTTAIVLSVLVHVLVLWYWRIPQPEPSPVLEFELLAARSPETPMVVEPEPEPTRDETEPVEPEPVEPVEPEVEPSQEIPAVTIPAAPDESETTPARAVLNLSPPADWDSLVNPEEPMRPRTGLEFNRRLSEAVTSRIRDRRRERLLTARERALYGLPEDVYGRTGPMGDVVKVDGACFSLEQTPDPGSAPRWWMVPCREANENPFERKPLETDARGRVVSD